MPPKKLTRATVADAAAGQPTAEGGATETAAEPTVVADVAAAGERTAEGGATEAAAESTVVADVAAAGERTAESGATDAALGPTVVVVAKQASRWRIGRNFGPEPVSIPAEELTDEEVDALKADSLLVVTFVDAPY